VVRRICIPGQTHAQAERDGRHLRLKREIDVPHIGVAQCKFLLRKASTTGTFDPNAQSGS
jgi:hypothetical protein